MSGLMQLKEIAAVAGAGPVGYLLWLLLSRAEPWAGSGLLPMGRGTLPGGVFSHSVCWTGIIFFQAYRTESFSRPRDHRQFEI